MKPSKAKRFSREKDRKNEREKEGKKEHISRRMSLSFCLSDSSLPSHRSGGAKAKKFITYLSTYLLILSKRFNPLSCFDCTFSSRGADAPTSHAVTFQNFGKRSDLKEMTASSRREKIQQDTRENP